MRCLVSAAKWMSARQVRVTQGHIIPGARPASPNVSFKFNPPYVRHPIRHALIFALSCLARGATIHRASEKSESTTLLSEMKQKFLK